jgi:cystathionine beta-lyase
MLDPHVCFLVERSLKTMALRVRQQNENAMKLAIWLSNHQQVEKVFYPGLPTHPGHEIAEAQMPGGFGGMLSFELRTDATQFLNKIRLIKRAISLGGVESTMCSSAKTSHAKMTAEERAAIGVSDNLIRFSVGIEDVKDIQEDIELAMKS